MHEISTEKHKNIRIYCDEKSRTLIQSRSKRWFENKEPRKRCNNSNAYIVNLLVAIDEWSNISLKTCQNRSKNRQKVKKNCWIQWHRQRLVFLGSTVFCEKKLRFDSVTAAIHRIRGQMFVVHLSVSTSLYCNLLTEVILIGFKRIIIENWVGCFSPLFPPSLSL